MIIANDLETLQNSLLEIAKNGKKIALVPTMGALHTGHASLITQAKEMTDCVVVSIFVNPTQFGKNEDYSIYPRTFDDDVKLAQQSGAEIIYAPTVEDMYTNGFSTIISVGDMGKILCGKFRPSHFDGVATVVTKLLLRIMPHIAIFGMKDYQQLCVIERLVSDLDIPTEIVGAPIIREEDGLALSSRNRYLSPDERKIAPILYKTLQNTAHNLKSNNVSEILAKGIADLTEAGYKVEYLELCDSFTLAPLAEYEEGSRLLVAAWLGKTRLIDNMSVEENND